MDRVPNLIKLGDYQVEQLLRNPAQYMDADTNNRRAGLCWRQICQFVTGRCINDFFELPREGRSEASLRAVFDRNWTNRPYMFHSNEHYLQMKYQLFQEISRFLLSPEQNVEPMMLYDQDTVIVGELDLELTFLVHLYWFSNGCTEEGTGGNGHVLQKVMVEADEEQATAYFHLAQVYCASAFKALPERLEVISLLNHKRFVYEPSPSKLVQSLDYMRLALTLLTPQSPHAADYTFVM